MHIGIMGSGGVGGYLGARLIESGETVSFIARGAHLAAMQTDGLVIESALGDARVAPVTVSNDPAAVGPVDVIVFAVKLYDMESAAQLIAPMVGPHTVIIPILNGIDCVDVLRAAHGTATVAGGVAQIAAVIDRPGVIHHTGKMANFLYGALDDAQRPALATFHAACTKAGINGHYKDDIEQAIWNKMVMLSAFSGVTALCRAPIGPVRDDRRAAGLLREAVSEAAAVGRAAGAKLPPGTEQRTLGFVKDLPGRMKSSMLEDLERGRPIEIDWLSGAIDRLGRKLGVPTPVHTIITSALFPSRNGTPTGS